MNRRRFLTVPPVAHAPTHAQADLPSRLADPRICDRAGLSSPGGGAPACCRH